MVDFAWACAVGIRFTGIVEFILSGAGLLAVGLLWRSFRRIEKFGEAVGNFGLWMCLVGAIVVFSYLCAHLSLPLLDSRFVAADRALGFDWLAWNSFVEAHPSFKIVLAIAYGSLSWQLMAVCFIAPFSHDRGRASEFLWITLLTAISACLISGVLPAEGALPFFNVGKAVWIDDLHTLRNGGPMTFEISHSQGIVTFPSFHAALCLIFSWSFRRMRFFGGAAIGLNLMMLISTPTKGGHYLVDVIAGLVLALVAILVVRRCRNTGALEQPDADGG
ncbi:phosphatase PAP2 family protein [Glacieibacterium sp.]|uniref:phosphatase PAP2 family protein n=1 Tax=Glacieibacterium sp. TaxID=2860237 RepID=UPI003B000C8C